MELIEDWSEHSLGASLKWISSSGGPLVLLNEKDVEQWYGGYSFTTDRSRFFYTLKSGGLAEEPDYMDENKTHYGKACAFNGLIGTVDFGGIKAIVLGDDPAATAWLPLFDKAGGCLARWIYAEGESEVDIYLKQIPESGWMQEGSFKVTSSPLQLQDSFVPGVAVEDGELLRLELDIGVYELDTLEYMPDQDTHLRLHRIKKRDDGC